VETALRHDLAWRPVTLAERQDRRHVRTAAGEVGPAVYIGPLATCFLASVAVALLARVTGASGIAEGLLLGVVIGVGIAGGAVVTGYFDPVKPKPMVWFAIMASYHLLGWASPPSS
jgi:hypothetical protein